MENIFIPLFLFALIMTVTPGPNNMLLTVSGARFGYRKTIPFILGVVAGLVSQLCLSALGLGALFERFPELQNILKAAGSLYILYLAYKISFSRKTVKENAEMGKPLNFFQGALFQYINPKACLMTITAMSVYSVQGKYYPRSVFLIIAVFALLTPATISLWAGFGMFLGRLAGNRHAGKINLLLGALTAGSVVFIFFP